MKKLTNKLCFEVNALNGKLAWSTQVYLRALFDYTPFEDKATPCQEAGLPFRRGDILQVVSQDDAIWWQAKKVGDCNLRAALVPSTQFQER